jgi:hypothetical protein
LTDTITLAPNPSNKCFGCGGANDFGMKLTFMQDNVNRRIVGRFILGLAYQGGGGMGKVCRFREVRAVTAELTVQYLKPVKVDEEIVVEGYEAEVKGRNLFLVGEIRNSAGEVLAKGTGRFVVIGQKEKSTSEARSS